MSDAGTGKSGLPVPRVAVKSHLDDDPKPRPDEIAEWNAMRVDYKLDTMIALIALPNEAAGPPMPGFELHWWEITERDGQVVCEPTDVQLEILEDT